MLGPVRFAVVQPAPAVENLVLGGGGMKSTGISAALQAYDEAGLLAGVKKIAGNSAGAITGGVLACGWPLEDVPKLNAQMSNFSAVFSPLDTGHQLRTMYPNLTLGVTAASHAARLVRAMDFQTATAVQKWLHPNEDELRRAMRSRRVTMAEVQQLDRLRRQDLNGSNREAQMVTFRDLEILHRISPEHFKLLSVTAYDSARQTNHTFDVDLNPDLPIAYAARASMAAPVAFTSVTIEGTRYLDGGFGANVPVDVIHGDKSGEALDYSRARTLLLAYESLGETNSSLHEKAPEPGWTQPLSDLIFRVLGQAAHARAELADRQRVWDTGPQTAVVHHGDLNTFDFGADPERVAFAISHSRVMAQEQVALRRQQAFHTVYERPEQVVAALDTKAREEIIRQLEALEQLTAGLDDPILSARGQLLSLLRAGQNSLAE
jgi:predicted acylesterase/phospholipase RssA